VTAVYGQKSRSHRNGKPVRMRQSVLRTPLAGLNSKSAIRAQLNSLKELQNSANRGLFHLLTQDTQEPLPFMP